MVTFTKYAEPTDITNVIGFFTHANTVTGGFFSITLILVLTVVAFLATSNFPKERSFAVASFTALLSSMFLHAMGIDSTNPIILSTITTIIAFYMLHKSTGGGD